MRKKCTDLRKIMLLFLNFFPKGSCFASDQRGRLNLMSIPNVMIKCCRWCSRTNIILLIWVSVVFLFHKCLRLLCIGLYTVSAHRLYKDAAALAHIFKISLLRCKYYHEYSAFEEEDFCER